MLSNLRANLRNSVSSLPPDTRTAWYWDIVTGLFAGLYQGCVWTFVSKVARANLHASNAQMAWIAAAPALGYVLATLWARQMDGKRKLPFVYWTWLIARGLFMLTPFIVSSSQFVALVVLTPFIFSVSTPAYTAIMKEIYPDKLRGRLMSVVRIGMNALMFGAAALAGYLMDHARIPFQTIFCVGGIFGAVSAWTFSRIPVSENATADGATMTTSEFLKDTVDILRRNPGFRWFSFSVFIYGFGNIIAFTLYPMYLVDRFHVSNTQVALLQNITAILTIIGFFFWGSFLDKKGPLTTVLVSLSIVCLAPLCYMLAWDFSLIILAAAFIGLAMSGIDLGYLNTTLSFAEPGRVAQYQALHSSFFGIRGSIAPFCAIPLMQLVGYRNSFLIAFSLTVGGTCLQLVAMRDYRESLKTSRKLAENKA